MFPLTPLTLCETYQFLWYGIQLDSGYVLKRQVPSAGSFDP
jgi:hypothetical protein